MRVEYLNPLLAFEPKNLSMLYCTFFSFLQYENMLISQTLGYPLHLKKKKLKSWFMATSYVVAGLQSHYLAK